MKVIIPLFALILLVILFPYARFTLKRIIFYFKLRTVCKKIGVRYYGNKPTWIFSTLKADNCDFYIETHDVVLSVKLAESMVRRAEIMFTDTSVCYLKSYRWSILPYSWMTVRPKAYTLPDYDFKYKLRENFSTKPLIPVLLILPLPAILKLRTDGVELEVQNGTLIADKYTVYSGKGFLNMLQ